MTEGTNKRLIKILVLDPVFKSDCGLPVAWRLILQGRIPKPLLVCGTSAPVLVSPRGFGTHLPSHSLLGLLAAETRLTERLLPELGSFLREREVGAGLHLMGFYSGLQKPVW